MRKFWHRVRQFNESPAEHVALNGDIVGRPKFGMVGGQFTPVPAYPMKMPVQSVTGTPVGIPSNQIEMQDLTFIDTGEGN